MRTAYARGYRVDEDGRVISPRGAIRRTVPEGSAGRHYFNLRVGERSLGKTVHVAAHELAAYQRFGERALEADVEVRHANLDLRDNRPANMMIGPSDGRPDEDQVARVAHARRAARVLRGLLPGQAVALRADRAAGMTYRELRRKYGIAESSISLIVNDRTYQDEVSTSTGSFRARRVSRSVRIAGA